MLESVFDKVVNVDVLDSGDSAHLSLLKRPELGVTLTKLHCWTLADYSKCVFLDADMLCVQNPDDLFSHPELSAVCDIGWPDCFNSGMFVFVPSLDTYGRLLQHSETSGSFDGGDQGLLNTFFPNWNRLSFVFNMVASATYTYLPAYKQYGGSVKLVHFLGAMKPWQYSYDTSSSSVHVSSGYELLAPYLNSWWAIYLSLVKPGVPEMDLQSAIEEKTHIDVQENDLKIRHTEEEHEHQCASNVCDDNEVKNSVHCKLLCSMELDSECVSNVIFPNDKDRSGNKETENLAMAAPTERVIEVAQQLAGVSIGSQSLQEEQARWERGEPEYLGRDSFANIQAYVDSKLKSGK
ncbi:glycogenin-1 isoform X4 [Cherax quadricarinatus]|nr:glycogenin-1-like isoform X4 [Cherax quadricarinatus]